MKLPCFGSSVAERRHLGMFWRFLFAMFISSLIGIEMFVVVTSVYGEWQLRQKLTPGVVAELLKNDLASVAPNLELAHDHPSLCNAVLRSLSHTSTTLTLLPDGGPNTLASMVKSGRLRLHYFWNGDEVCSYPANHRLAARAEQGSAIKDSDNQYYSVTRTSAEGVPTQLTLELTPRRAFAQMLQATKEIPWNVLLLFTAFQNFCCALTLAPILVRRIKRAEVVARGWTEGNMLARINDSRHDEFGNLVRSFNQLADSFVDVIKVKQELAAVEERNRLARDLHDTAKQRAFALNLQLTALESLGASNQVESTRLATSALSLVHHLQNDLSNVIKRLSASTIAEVGMREVLCQEITSLFDGSGIYWDVSISDEVDGVLRETPQLAQQILLIAIEAAANVLRHSSARTMRVKLTEAGDEYTLAIEDDGKGLDTVETYSLGMGLTNMRLRTRSLPKGVFSMVNKDSGGIVVSVRFQL
jgi:signal transduction histidine kinase